MRIYGFVTAQIMPTRIEYANRFTSTVLVSIFSRRVWNGVTLIATTSKLPLYDDSPATAVVDDGVESRPTEQLTRPPAISFRWDYIGFFAALHLISLLVLVPWFFSWQAVVAFVSGVIVFGQLGIPIGYHRMLSHRSFRSPKWFERTLVTLAMCSGQETPARWVAWHRKHHAHSDQNHDPHSPRLGLIWAHSSWLFQESRTTMGTFSMYQKYARDILDDPYYRWLEKLPGGGGVFYLAHAALYAVVSLAICLAMFGNTAEAYRMTASLFVWGVVARTVWTWHITWSVNSLSHVFGYRNYATKDDSRNNWFVTLLTSGEGWHNNHHADPASASVQHQWWEIDINYYIIRLFGIIGLADKIIQPRFLRKRKRNASNTAIKS